MPLTERLFQKLVRRETSRKTTVFADLVWAFWRSQIPRDADLLISLVSVEVRHLRCRSNLIHKAALGLLGTCVEMMTAAISPSAQRAHEGVSCVSWVGTVQRSGRQHRSTNRQFEKCIRGGATDVSNCNSLPRVGRFHRGSFRAAKNYSGVSDRSASDQVVRLAPPPVTGVRGSG